MHKQDKGIVKRVRILQENGKNYDQHLKALRLLSLNNLKRQTIRASTDLDKYIFRDN